MRLIRSVVSVSLASVCLSRPVDGQVSAPGSIEIRLATGSDLEQQGRAQLERILASWDLSRWFFTRTVLIQSGVIPHSHPVLTLNTNSLANDTIKAKSFIHEQLHWFLSKHHTATDSAMADLLRLYPNVPDGPSGGASDRESTNLHLLVGLLEFDALRELFGEAAARRLLARTPFYTWIYREVLERPEPIRNILRKYRLESPDARAPTPLLGQRVETGFLDRTVIVAGTPHRYQVYVPASYAGSTQRWPVILFLHGGGERGSDGLLQTAVGLPAAIRGGSTRYPAIVVMPQVQTDSVWLGAPAQVAMAALDQTLAEFRADPERVYLTGLSLGGNGTWNLAYRFPERFAAIAPICGFISVRPQLRASRSIVPADSGDAFVAIARRLGRLPTWIFHGEVDPVVPVSESRRAAEALRAAGGNVRYTEVLGGGHNVWDGTYASPQFQEWLFAQRRGK